MSGCINEKVGAWLLEEGNTRGKLAKEIGISRPALSKRLSGDTEWNWNDVLVIAKVTGCTLNELAGITES